MTSTTDALRADADTSGRDTGRHARSRIRALSSGRRVLPWAALAAAAITTAVLAVSVFRDEDPGPPANRTALRNDAERYVEWLESRAASVAEGGASTGGFVPGNLPALERDAERYVEWLESRAASVAEGGASIAGASTAGAVAGGRHPSPR